jgi:hypothetical protein
VLHLWSSGGGVTAGLHQNFPVVKNKKKNKKNRHGYSWAVGTARFSRIYIAPASCASNRRTTIQRPRPEFVKMDGG